MLTKRKKARAKKKLDLPTWLTERIEATGATQLQISEEIGVNANDLSRWKNGQAVPEMDNLLRLAHYFNQDPEPLFYVAGKPELIDVYRLFLPKYQKKQVTEKDLYKNPTHAELHRRLEELLAKGYHESREEGFLFSVDLTAVRLHGRLPEELDTQR